MFNGYRTYIGIIIALSPTIAGLFGYDMTPAFAEQLPVMVDDLVVIIGGAIAFYGRAVASIPGWIARRNN